MKLVLIFFIQKHKRQSLISLVGQTYGNNASLGWIPSIIHIATLGKYILMKKSMLQDVMEQGNQFFKSFLLGKLLVLIPKILYLSLGQQQERYILLLPLSRKVQMLNHLRCPSLLPWILNNRWVSYVPLVLFFLGITPLLERLFRLRTSIWRPLRKVQTSKTGSRQTMALSSK